MLPKTVAADELMPLVPPRSSVIKAAMMGFSSFLCRTNVVHMWTILKHTKKVLPFYAQPVESYTMSQKIPIYEQ
jgi:hypothetical protein